jgi:SAM-dependent methyltransferase
VLHACNGPRHQTPHLPVIDPQCPVCGGEGRLWGVRRDFQLLRCPRCDLVYLPVEPTESAIRSLYDQGYFVDGSAVDGYVDYLGEETTHRRQARSCLRFIARLGWAPGKLLDVGCAAGFLLDEARKGGWDVTGIDASDYAAGQARARFGVHVVTGVFPEGLQNAGPFDVITSLNVIEHLPRSAAVERRCAELLRPGGLLFIETWNRDSIAARIMGRRWHQWAPPSVLVWHNRSSLLRLFAPPAWEPVAWKPWRKWITVRRALAILRLPAPPALSAVMVPYQLGDLVVAAFRRTGQG